jgi:hypothetical protein
MHFNSERLENHTLYLYGCTSIPGSSDIFLSRQDGIDLCSDFKTTGQVLEIYRKMSFDSNSRTGIKVRFLTDINKDNISLCKELV